MTRGRIRAQGLLSLREQLKFSHFSFVSSTVRASVSAVDETPWKPEIEDPDSVQKEG